ncbi:hypothetical protein E4L95_00960 [Paracoccus liaowanqingii]|uniref:Uncharacterized protein n=1 Tax=Paracoccus liaowanqingii TaxID=2560053 RepID=A0A4Z1CSS2_9RHOB|nr:hypothetical protein [Paracoccus liaowanqingii]TGN68553.1 hypothetical protein E4L95_00960 [Paracoccus liaowanqingii]
MPDPEHPPTPLAFHDAGQPYREEDAGQVFFDIRAVLVDIALPKRVSVNAAHLDSLSEEDRASAIEVMRTTIEAELDKPATFLAVAQGSGTHILKLLNSSVAGENNVLRLAPAGVNRRQRYLPSVNAAITPYAKIIHRPIAIIGREGNKSLVDHIVEPDEVSPVIFESFSRAFSPESLELIRTEILEPRTEVTALYGANFPIVYGPSPEGGDIQITPISSLHSLNVFRRAVLPSPGSGERVSLANQELSAKPQNISSAISGRRYRFMARFPRPLNENDASVRRMVMGSHVPSMTMDQTLQDLLIHYGKLHRKIDSEEDFSNRSMRAGLARLGAYLVEMLHTHIEDLRESALALDPNFKMREFDPVNLLLGGSWKDKDERIRVRSALSAPGFRKLLAERGL